MDNRQQAGAEGVDGEAADVFGIEPEGLGVEGFVGRCGRLLEVNDRVGAVDAFEGKHIHQFLAGHVLAIVFGRPAQQA